MRPPKIKTIITPKREYFAAFMPDKEGDIEQRVERVLCWSLMEFPRPDEPDEVVGQIIVGDTITEVTNVDDEEGFGEFIGYYETAEDASTAIMVRVSESESDDEEDEVEDEDLDSANEDGDEDEDDGEDED